jgi:hypothetical protein
VSGDSLRRKLRGIGWILLACLVVAAAWVVVRQGGRWLDQVSAHTWQLSWFNLAISAILLLYSLWLIPEGWVRVCRALGSRERKRLLRAVWFASQLGRYVPGKIWLFAGRAGFLRGKGMTMPRAAAGPVAELLFTAAAAGVSSLAGLLIWGGGMAGWLFHILLAASALAVLLPFLHPLQRLLIRMRGGPADAETPLNLVASDSLLLLGLYSGLWVMRALALLLWLRGFGMEGIGFGACLAGVPLSWLAGYSAFFVPGGIGVREAALVGILSTGGETGPLLVAVAGQRLLLSLGELALGLLSFRTFAGGREEPEGRAE